MGPCLEQLKDVDCLKGQVVESLNNARSNDRKMGNGTVMKILFKLLLISCEWLEAAGVKLAHVERAMVR